ncbi:NAD-binding protein [Pyxidicoccus fallax]|uniref:NAD-binding protein n=1 Tax=Pyxidicoccus fallax TaxID=394095 RepID=A0A848LDX8_9BACT|nr:FAD-dependent oxidoreductase [Pyxidicoccus fallax]NMO16907.1 NAD-binding protein [Pyxidicoccus fallax]NPC80414.1 NAD-binding protein [Pyxidicoccus fallax]
MKDVIEVEVAVVGGGPTGLMLACELALAGIRVTVFERRAEPVRQSRALTLHPRSLEVLALRGLAPRFLERGRPIPTGHFAMLDTRLDFSVLDTSFPFTLYLPQLDTEQLLEARARELGVDVRRGHEVEALRQDSEGVSLEGTAAGAAFRCEARYVVGADGARSRVRQLAGIRFVGTDTTLTAMLGDVVLGEPPATPAHSVNNARGGVMLVPLGPSLHRVVIFDPARARVPLQEAVTLEELKQSSVNIAGTDFGMREPRWLSRFGNETRLAERYRVERVLLAGDAAHIHFPAGGQGLNVGLQDAMNLGWKLAGVLRGHAPATLLDSYHQERAPVGEALLRNTEAQTALMPHDASVMALRDLLSDLLKSPALNRPLADRLAGFDGAYPALDLPAPPHEGEPLKALTGRRLPDLALTLRDGSVRRLYSLLHDGKWLWLRLREGGRTPEWGRWTHVVEARRLEEREELVPVGDMLIRPDGHVGWAWAPPSRARAGMA